MTEQTPRRIGIVITGAEISSLIKQSGAEKRGNKLGKEGPSGFAVLLREAAATRYHARRIGLIRGFALAFAEKEFPISGTDDIGEVRAKGFAQVEYENGVFEIATEAVSAIRESRPYQHQPVERRFLL